MALTKEELDREVAAWRKHRAASGFPVEDAPAPKSAPAVKSGLSARLSARDIGIIKGFAPVIHEYVKREIEAAIAPLKAEIERLKTLAETRPPAAKRRDRDGDARGPDFFEWRQ
jgi:hypothetical protein